MAFLIRLRSEDPACDQSQADTFEDAFLRAGEWATALAQQQNDTVVEIVQLPEQLVVLYCQNQPHVGLHYWTPGRAEISDPTTPPGTTTTPWPPTGRTKIQ